MCTLKSIRSQKILHNNLSLKQNIEKHELHKWLYIWKIWENTTLVENLNEEYFKTIENSVCGFKTALKAPLNNSNVTPALKHRVYKT